MHPANIFDGIPAELAAELFTPLQQSAGVRIERIVSQGHVSPPGFWYDQNEHEWLIVLQGSAMVEFAGDAEPVPLTAGTYLHIPAHAKHRVTWTDPAQQTIWLAIYYGG